MSNSVITSIREFVREGAIGRTKTKDKADCATVEKAIDPKTRMLIIKVLKAGPDMTKSMAALLQANKPMFIMRLKVMARKWLSRCTRHLFWILSKCHDTFDWWCHRVTDYEYAHASLKLFLIIR